MNQTQTLECCKRVVQGWSSPHTAHTMQGRELEPRAVHTSAVPSSGRQKGRDTVNDRCQDADEFTVFRVVNQIRAGLSCPSLISFISRLRKEETLLHPSGPLVTAHLVVS